MSAPARGRSPRASRNNPNWHKRLRYRLSVDDAALAFLSRNLGLERGTVEHFGMGLSESFSSRDGAKGRDALMYPLIDSEGTFNAPYGYHVIPGVTINPPVSPRWSRGAPAIYYSHCANDRTGVIVCGAVTSLWRMWQELDGLGLTSTTVLIASTRDEMLPAVWREHEFWTRWSDIYLAFDADERGEIMARETAERIGREARRLSPPSAIGATWADYWRHGGTAEDLVHLMDEAPLVRMRLETAPDSGSSPGRFSYEPININGAFVNGHLYCTVQTVKREAAASHLEVGDAPELLERLETVVIRSDRTLHTATYVPSPRGTMFRDRVLRLSDGTPLIAEPRPSQYATWSWTSIRAYIDGKSQTRPLRLILQDVITRLRAGVWLPETDDYVLLALAVVVTYVQAVFDSVPLFLVCGPSGSGKSELGRLMARLCANAYICGQTSPASIARLIDEARGFVVIDDLESIGHHRRGVGRFDELTQQLKLSYTKETAVRNVINLRTGRAESLNLFGVKMINNTRGADYILGSRMLRVRTRRVPDHHKGSLLAASSHSGCDELRDELHTWAFKNVAQVDALYRRLYPQRSDRADEITAPLKVIATLVDDSDVNARLRSALVLRERTPVDADKPLSVMRRALDVLITQGYITISVTHLTMEVRRLLAEDEGAGAKDAFPEWACSEWIGKRLREHELIEVGEMVRRRLYGANLRFYPLRVSYLEATRSRLTGQEASTHVESRTPTAFCLGCDGCPYQRVGCEIMPARLRVEQYMNTTRSAFAR